MAELLKRLEALAHELHHHEQEELDTSSLNKVSHELASGHLLAHRDKGVRAWTCCAIVDILRLCAPDAPFTASELKDIFTAIITSIIPALADPSNAYNEQHIYILGCLADVKSIVLLTDLDNADTLILSLFSSCFDIVSGSTKASTGEELAKKVEYDMIRLLVPVIDEAPTLIPEVIDVIIAQFLRVDPRALALNDTGANKGKKKNAALDPKQRTLLPKEYPPAYDMAKAICSACPEKMTSYVSQYFNNVILDASASAKISNASGKRANNAAIAAGVLDDSEDEAEDINELSKAHRLIRELWRACPDILQNVVPQIEAELSAESVSLRLLATQTIGDMVSGIGVAGPPPPPPMDPAAYPQAKLGSSNIRGKGMLVDGNVLLTPLSPKPFSQVHSTTYNAFMRRRQDRSVSVRAAWATAIGRIILTNAGGVGLSNADLTSLVHGLSIMMADADENVRIAGVEALGTFSLDDIVMKIGIDGSVDASDSVLAVLAERVKDRKQSVREVAMRVLSRMWGVASGEIEQGNEVVVKMLKGIPSRILSAFYANNLEIEVLINRAMYESLLPLNYPPIKHKGKDKEEKAKDIDADAIRAKRILTLAKHLDEKAKRVFFLFQSRQLNIATFMRHFITACEEHNGGVMEARESEIKEKLTRIIVAMSRTLPDATKAAADLWKFATMHDRRTYHLIRFAMDVNSDYKTVVRAIRELTKRIESSSSPLSSSFEEYLLPLVYRCSSLVFNRSHVPHIMEISRTDELGLGGIAHECLKEISTQNPEVLEAHVADICKDIEDAAPDVDKEEESTSRDVEQLLKACAGFAKKLPAKIPKERKFMIALTKYALYSRSPKAAKHAVTTLISSSDKKEMYAKQLVEQSVTDWKYGEKGYLTKLATIAQLNLLCPEQADEASDQIINIATEEVLLKNRSGQAEGNTSYKWSEEVDDETAAKVWALRILVNRVRSKDSATDEEGFRSYATPVFALLTKLVEKNGELSEKGDTPATQKARLRLVSANLILKLCSCKVLCDRMFTPSDFNKMSLVAQDPLYPVRSGFISQLKKRLTQASHIGSRWYTIAFLLAFEPDIHLKESSLTWLRARTMYFARQSGREQQTIMESLASRLLSLLAYHPDYPPESLPAEDKVEDLSDFARYILFYLSAVANGNNLSLIFHIFQRVKQVQDAILHDNTISERLYTLSDLAQATTRRFADIYSQQRKIGGSGAQAVNLLQTFPGKMRLPSDLFSNLTSHSEAQVIAETNYLSEDVDDKLDKIVRVFMKPPKHSQALAGTVPQSIKKRKPESSESTSGKPTSPKRVKKERQRTLTSRTSSSKTAGASSTGSSKSKTPKRKRRADENGWGSDVGDDEDDGDGEGASSSTKVKKVQATERRRSGRRSSGNNVSYVEADSDEDDEMMQEWDHVKEGNEDKEEKDENEMDVDDDEDDDEDDADSATEGQGEDQGHTDSEEESGDEKQNGQTARAESAAAADGNDNDNGDGENEEAVPEEPEREPLSNASNQPTRRGRPAKAKQQPEPTRAPTRRSRRAIAN